MQVKLIYLGFFETEFKEQTYKIYQFLHPSSLTILSGTNIEESKKLVLDETYNCEVALRRGKLKVVSILQ